MCCGECERAASSRDPDPWRNASDADEHAYKLQQVAFRTPTQRTEGRYHPSFARNAKTAAEAFEVAADAWEEVGDETKAEIRRNNAHYFYVEAFIASHRYLSYGYYLVSDAEARRLSDGSPPRPGRFIPFRFTPWGARPAELHRIWLTDFTLPDRKRRWAYAVAGVR